VSDCPFATSRPTHPNNILFCVPSYVRSIFLPSFDQHTPAVLGDQLNDCSPCQTARLPPAVQIKGRQLPLALLCPNSILFCVPSYVHSIFLPLISTLQPCLGPTDAFGEGLRPCQMACCLPPAIQTKGCQLLIALLCPDGNRFCVPATICSILHASITASEAWLNPNCHGFCVPNMSTKSFVPR
jgi:hypothetical protein